MALARKSGGLVHRPQSTLSDFIDVDYGEKPQFLASFVDESTSGWLGIAIVLVAAKFFFPLGVTLSYWLINDFIYSHNKKAGKLQSQIKKLARDGYQSLRDIPDDRLDYSPQKKVTFAEVCEVLYGELDGGEQEAIDNILASQGGVAALDEMMALLGVTGDDLETFMPGALSAIMQQSSVPTTVSDPLVTLGGSLSNSLSQSQKVQIKAIKDSQGRVAAIEAMIRVHGISDEEIEDLAPGALAALRPKAKNATTTTTHRKEYALQVQSQLKRPLGEAPPIEDFDLANYIYHSPRLAHILGTGETGTGKTTILEHIIHHALEDFGDEPDFKLEIIDPKNSPWGGYSSHPQNYIRAKVDSRFQLEKAVAMLERHFAKIDKRGQQRNQGRPAIIPQILVIDEVNLFLDALKSMDDLIADDIRSIPQRDRTSSDVPLNLYRRATFAIANIARAGREDRVLLWMLGQNPNLEALGLTGGSDRANFTFFVVGLDTAMTTISLALQNNYMFPGGGKMLAEVAGHKGHGYQIAACSALDQLVKIPQDYPDIKKQRIEYGAPKQQTAPTTDVWADAEDAVSPTNHASLLGLVTKLEQEGYSISDLKKLLAEVEKQ